MKRDQADNGDDMVLAVYDGRLQVGSVLKGKGGGFVAALRNGDAVGIFTKSDDAARAIMESWQHRYGGL